jgi:UDP-N-acetylglucosamine--N-acetylmuramyl-(pentapeptide) pyrophosphoryl-undecaprenol N-acetylglucosamine transferase
MLDAVPLLTAGEEVVVQYGPGEPPPGVARAEAFMPFDRMLACYREASAVFTHAGVGSILCARRAGHRPIVVPRYRELGEHVDDHQVELTQALSTLGEVVPAWRDQEIASVVAACDGSDREARRSGGDGALQSAVRAALLGAQ